MVEFGPAFGYHEREGCLAGDDGSVGKLHDEAEILFQDRDPHYLVQVGGVKLYFGIQSGRPVLQIVRIVDLARGVDLFQYGLDVAVVRLYEGGIELAYVGLQIKTVLGE